MRDFTEILEITRAGGFRIELDDDKARTILQEMSLIAGEPFAGEYDFSSSDLPERMRAYSRKHVAELVRLRPPPEAIMFFRAIAGITENLRLLGAKGDFRPVFLAVLDEPLLLV